MNMPAEIDAARPVRPGEELNLGRLGAYLESHFHQVYPLRIEQFPSGFSNLTYLLKAGEQEYVLRRPPFGAKARTAHDMGREFRILSQLKPVYSRVPRPVLACEDESVLGAPFYIMERVRGTILRPHTKQAQAPPPGQMKLAAEALVDALAGLHALDLAAAGLEDFGKPSGYVKRQVTGWSGRYGRARTHDVPAMDRVAQWLEEQQPAESGVALIHNDFKYDNLVFDQTDFSEVRAILDWEMATVGDPMMDLGSTLAYWTDPEDAPEMHALSLSPTTLTGNPRRMEVAERYAAQSGRALDGLVFYYVFGLFKIAVIVQQIYHRYQRGDTRDARFASLHEAVPACARTAWQAAQAGRVDRLFQE